MANIKLFVTHSPNSSNYLIDRHFVYNVVAGSDYHNGIIPEGMVADNTGDNISSKNKSFCELTTLYWAWKNVDADYYGFCHYRRLLSFASKSLASVSKREWGVYSFDCLTESKLDLLGWDQASVEQIVNGYDFVIAEHINTKDLGSKSVFDNWRDADALYEEDLSIFMSVLQETCPELMSYAKKYMQGNIFYPCNMFVMKKGLLNDYCEKLFKTLFEYEKRADFSHYSVETLRVTGHLAERFTGIYYEYTKSLGECKCKEVEATWFAKTCPQKKLAPSVPDARGIVLAANNAYAPYLAVCLNSLCERLNDGSTYDIAIFNTDFSAANKQKILEQSEKYSQINVIFIDVTPWVAEYNPKNEGIVDHISVETFYRFLILEIMADYDYVLYLDSDMIVNADVSSLFELDLGDSLVAAVIDADYLANVNLKDDMSKRPKSSSRLKYSKEVLRLKDPYSYFQAGLIMFNVPALRRETSTAELMEMAASPKYIYMDQDILNIVCQGKIYYLDMRWNVMMDHSVGLGRANLIKRFTPAEIKDQYFTSRNDPFIIHYAGPEKPWKNPECDFAEEFWAAAKKTSYYEAIIGRMVNGEKKPTKVSFLHRLARIILPHSVRSRLIAILRH